MDISDRKQAEEALREAHAQLGRRVEQRTAELAKVNDALKAETEQHKQTEAARTHFMQQLINAKEAERHRIAPELHNQMGQHFSALILGLKVLRDATPESSPVREPLLQAVLPGISTASFHTDAWGDCLPRDATHEANG